VARAGVLRALRELVRVRAPLLSDQSLRGQWRKPRLPSGLPVRLRGVGFPDMSRIIAVLRRTAGQECLTRQGISLGPYSPWRAGGTPCCASPACRHADGTISSSTWDVRRMVSEDSGREAGLSCWSSAPVRIVTAAQWRLVAPDPRFFQQIAGCSPRRRRRGGQRSTLGPFTSVTAPRGAAGTFSFRPALTVAREVGPSHLRRLRGGGARRMASEDSVHVVSPLSASVHALT
jgi:hypothetical protein